jgi:hypothetical protein
LNKGTTKDSFQMAAKTPAGSGKLKTNVKGTLTSEANRFKIAGVIPSKPRKAHSTSPSEISIVDDCRQELAGPYLRFEKTQQINFECSVSLGHNRYPKT